MDKATRKRRGKDTIELWIFALLVSACVVRKLLEIAADEDQDEEHLRLWAAREAKVEPKTDGRTDYFEKMGVLQNRGALRSCSKIWEISFRGELVLLCAFIKMMGGVLSVERGRYH